MAVRSRRSLGATYRLQLHAGFTLADATAILDYLRDLGIATVYLSPVLQARADSTHGYDVTDPTRVRDVLGGADAFRAFADRAAALDLQVLLDIVPNHMASSEEGLWFRDLLEFGPDSRYARHFDLSWRTDPAATRIVLPVLGAPAAEVAAAGDLVPDLDADGIALRYFQRRFPLAPATYTRVLGPAGEPDLDEIADGSARHDMAALLGEFARLHADAPRDVGRARAARDRLLELVAESDEVQAIVRRRISRSRDVDPALRGSAILLLLGEQHYDLVHWRDIGRRIGYRRFFDITDLIGVRVEDALVFGDTHARILDWVGRGRVHALRIDHVDGLLDPTGYLADLATACADRGAAGTPILVEKILAPDEDLPAEWPCDGTTGYDFLNTVNSLFIEAGGYGALAAFFRAETGENRTFRQVVAARKRDVIRDLFGGELDMLATEFAELERALGGDVPRDDLAHALIEVTAQLAVYRTYIREFAMPPADGPRLERALTDALAPDGGAEPPAADAMRTLRRVLLLHESIPARHRAAVVRFIMRWEQFTGPAMAKGLEDTALYTYVPLLSANDVGGEPTHAAREPGDVHALLARRAEAAPRSLNATSTHDTKRSEDVRARLNVLSELPDDWIALVHRWHQRHAPTLRQEPDGPDAIEEAVLYQSIAGAWPTDATEREAFIERIRRYMEKAMREAKLRTSWLHPDETHEATVLAFAERVLRDDAFVQDMEAWVRRIGGHGAATAIAATLIKCMAPGVPDFYQGTELWAFDLVDPDNRRPVDYALRRRLLSELESLIGTPAAGRAAALFRDWQNGRAKLFVTAVALRLRAEAPDLFAGGRYTPLDAAGPGARHVFAFARSREGAWCIVAVPRFTASLSGTADLPEPGSWRGTRLRLPPEAPGMWRCRFTGASHRAGADGLELVDVFGEIPFALLTPAE
jgi:(1->4)-alpha-D-glucan 1-alpha-D-glucosylmutase